MDLEKEVVQLQALIDECNEDKFPDWVPFDLKGAYLIQMRKQLNAYLARMNKLDRQGLSPEEIRFFAQLFANKIKKNNLDED